MQFHIKHSSSSSPHFSGRPGTEDPLFPPPCKHQTATILLEPLILNSLVSSPGALCLFILPNLLMLHSWQRWEPFDLRWDPQTLHFLLKSPGYQTFTVKSLPYSTAKPPLWHLQPYADSPPAPGARRSRILTEQLWAFQANPFLTKFEFKHLKPSNSQPISRKKPIQPV